jgi:Zn-dependent protease
VLLGLPQSGIGAQILTTAITVNLGFFVFNILPIPPLDGSRVLYALAPEFVRTGMRFIESYGIILVFALVIFAGAFIGTYMSTVINFFISAFMTIFMVQ